MKTLAAALAVLLAVGSAHAEAWFPSGQVQELLGAMKAAKDRFRVRQGETEAGIAADQAPPINAGFRSLGPTGAAGKVDGPSGQADGRYRMVLNSPFEIAIEIKTGYIDGVITLRRNPATGTDSMRFAGRMWKDDAWGPAQDTARDAVVSYNPSGDKGTIRWSEEGKGREESFKNGGDDDGKMTIDFDGWGHDFIRD